MVVKLRFIIVMGILLTILLALSIVNAADVYFSATNDILEPLEAYNMPYNQNGTIYVHYSRFQSRELGTNAILSKSSNIVQVSKGETYLRFNFGSGQTYDHEDNTYAFKTIFRNGVPYLPARATCEFLGLSFSLIEALPAPIIRLKNDDSHYDDQTFANSASALMHSRLAEYLAVSPSPSLYTPEPPITPSIPPSLPPTPTASLNFADTEVYLAFIGPYGDYSASILDKLAKYDYKVCFFLTVHDIKSDPAFIRQLLGMGHSAALLSDSDSESGSDFRLCSEYLRLAADYKTEIAAALYDDSAADAAMRLNLCFWFDSTADILYADSPDPVFISAPDTSNKRLDVILAADFSPRLDSILYALKAGGYNVKKIRETEQTLLDVQDVY